MRSSGPVLLLLLAGLPGCDDAEEAPPPAEAPAPIAEGSDAGAIAAPTPAPTPTPAGTPDRVAARHILVAFQGAQGADPSLRRTRAEALARARELLGRVRAGEDFAALARTESDDPNAASQGGHLGAFEHGDMHPAFEAVAFQLQPGQISEVVETPFGYHLIRGEPLDEVRLSHIVVQWQGQGTATRSKDEARALAGQAVARVQAGEPFEAVAASLSDGPAGVRGGELGWFQRGQLLPALEEPAFSLAPGQVSGVVETPAGFHVLYRAQ